MKRTPRARWWIVLSSLVVGSSGCASKPPEPLPPVESAPVMKSTPFILPGVRLPETQPAGKAELADAEPVLGVVVNGKARAYSIRALSSMSSHVVNDLVARVPITVTYCDQVDCARVFTDDSRGEPLEVDLGGFDRGMLLRHAGIFYRQENGHSVVESDDARFPFKTIPYQRTTWKDWKKAYPDSDVYVGKRP